MKTIGVYEAKNRLSELIDRVEAGEIIVITRNGKKKILLQPIGDAPKISPRQAIEKMKKLRAHARLGGISIKELRDEGRP